MSGTPDTTAILGVVLLVLLSLGVSLVRRDKRPEEFLICRRNLGLFQSCMSICGTFVGMITLLVYTAFVVEFGIAALWIFIGYLLGFTVFGLFGVFIRSGSATHITLTDYFRARFGPGSARLVLVILILWYFGTLCAQFVGGGKILSMLTGLDPGLAVALIAGTITPYLLSGGFRSLIRTDVLQFLAVGFILASLVAGLPRFGPLPPQALDPMAAGLPKIAAFLLFGLFVPLATQDYWQKTFAMKNDRVVKWSFPLSAVLLLVLALLLTAVGLAARNAFPDLDPEQSVLRGFMLLSPEPVRQLIPLLFLAALLSTADTVLFLLGLNIGHDLVGSRGVRPEKTVLATRMAIVGVAVLATATSLLFQSIVDIAIVFKSLGISIAPMVLLLWRGKVEPRAMNTALGLTGLCLAVLVLAGWIVPELLLCSLGLVIMIYGAARLVQRIAGLPARLR